MYIVLYLFLVLFVFGLGIGYFTTIFVKVVLIIVFDVTFV
jgi:hypothetical protein